MDPDQLEKLMPLMRNRDTAELLQIWATHNEYEWTEESFEAVKTVILERGEDLPEIVVESEEREEIEGVRKRSKLSSLWWFALPVVFLIGNLADGVYDWESVALAMIMGAASAGIASLIVKRREKRLVFAVLVGLIYVILSQVADTYMRPHLSDLGFLEEEEIFQVIKKHEPDLYADLKTQLEGASRQQSEEQARAFFAATFSQMTSKYAPIASDSALVAFMEFTVEIGEVIGQQDSELAMKWFYPDQFGRPGSLRSLIGPLLEGKMLPALSDLIRSGATMPSVFKADSRIDSLLEILGIELADRYGDEALEGLVTPSMEDSERHVAMFLSTYKRVFEFPFDERALMLRYLITDDAE